MLNSSIKTMTQSFLNHNYMWCEGKFTSVILLIRLPHRDYPLPVPLFCSPRVINHLSHLQMCKVSWTVTSITIIPTFIHAIQNSFQHFVAIAIAMLLPDWAVLTAEDHELSVTSAQRGKVRDFHYYWPVNETVTCIKDLVSSQLSGVHTKHNELVGNKEGNAICLQYINGMYSIVCHCHIWALIFQEV